MSFIKFDEPTRRKVIDAAARCNFRTTTARVAGISPATLKVWLSRGATDPDGNPIDDHPDVAKYVQFRHEYELARAQSEDRMVTDIQTDKDWKAKAWILERAFRQWSGKTALLGLDSGEVLDPDTRAAAVQELRAMGPEMVDLMIEAWCHADLAHAPAGVKQVHRALSERWGWV